MTTRSFQAALAAAVVLAVGTVPHVAVAAPKLAEAASRLDLKKVQKLIDAGAAVDEPDAEGRTALSFAARYNNLELAQQLVAKGAAVDQADREGVTPLMAALSNPLTKLPMVEFLLSKGANVNATAKDGRTPLMYAVLRAPGILDVDAQTAMIDRLLAAGADAAAVDTSGATALHHAAFIGEPRKVLERLLTQSKAPDAFTVSGANILMMAAQNRQRANVEFLLGRGFRPTPTKAVAPDGKRPELAQDTSHRANALAQDWWGQFATRKGDIAAANAAFTAAAADYDRAAAEAYRLAGLYDQELVKDKNARNQHRAAVGFVNALSMAATLGAGGGYTTIYMANVGTKVEEDERIIALLRGEVEEFTKRAADLRAKVDANRGTT